MAPAYRPLRLHQPIAISAILAHSRSWSHPDSHVPLIPSPLRSSAGWPWRNFSSVGFPCSFPAETLLLVPLMPQAYEDSHFFFPLVLQQELNSLIRHRDSTIDANTPDVLQPFPACSLPDHGYHWSVSGRSSLQ